MMARRPDTGRLRRLSCVADQIGDGDLLLWRHGDDLVSRMIRAGGRSRYRHAAKVARINGHLTVLEVRQWVGGQAMPLAEAVERWPGEIDVYEVNPGNRWPEYSRAGAIGRMQRFVGGAYGYWGLLKAALLHMVLVRLFVRPDMNDYSNGRVPFCSQACAIADRCGGGVDPVPNLADRITEPGDLARSLLYAYRFTLVP